MFDRPGGRVLTLDGRPHRGQPIMLSGFGGIKLRRDDAADPADTNGVSGFDASALSTETWCYSSACNAQEFAEMFERLLAAVVHTPLFSGFCYTQFADTFRLTVAEALPGKARP